MALLQPQFSVHEFYEFMLGLSPLERNELKYLLSRTAVGQLEEIYNLPEDSEKCLHFDYLLECLRKLQPHHDKIPACGIVYSGRPSFINDSLLAELQLESDTLRPAAHLNNYQLLAQQGECAAKLSGSADMLNLVKEFAGDFENSHVESYIYYDQPAHCSKPHVDNDFTALTVMIGLEHQYQNLKSSSATLFYSPGNPRLEYRLKPGEMIMFFGSAVLHGRLPLSPGERVRSLLLSFSSPS